MKKQISYKVVSLVFSILVVCFAIAFYAVAWDEPLQNPPGCTSRDPGCDAPINVGNVGQHKTGTLRVAGLTADGETHLAWDSGNVGIGTRSPGDKLHIANPGGGNQVGIYFEDPTDSAYGGRIYFDDTSNTFRFGTVNNNVETLGIVVNGSTGNVGIGSTGSTIHAEANLHVYQIIDDSARMYLEASGDRNSYTALYSNGVRKVVYGYRYSDDALKLSHRESGTGAELDNNDFVLKEGFVGIGRVNAGPYKLEVAGGTHAIIGRGTQNGVEGQGGAGFYDFWASGDGINYGGSSSIRWKKNIKQIDSALDKVMKLRGVYFDWDEEHGGQHDIGMIGEEVGEILPEIVAWDEDNPEFTTGMDYSKLTPLLVEAIKEQQKEIEALKAQLNLRQ